MIINFTQGFVYENFSYGWFEQDLYRLPSTSGNKEFGLKKLSPIRVGNKEGFRIKRKRFTNEQLRQRSILIKITLHINNDTKHIPS